MCDLERSGIGLVPCKSFFVSLNQETPMKTISAYASRGDFDEDRYEQTVYRTFQYGISGDDNFKLPNNWPSFCGNGDAGFSFDPVHGFVVTPTGGDSFKLMMNSPPVLGLGSNVVVSFIPLRNWYYNCTNCVSFNSITFTNQNWDIPQIVKMNFKNFGCSQFGIYANGGGYDWQYTINTVTVYACNGTPGEGCTGREPCGENQ